MKMFQNLTLIATIITHYLLVGADLYAQTSITPVALSAPPASLAMYQGDYVYNPAAFWQITNTFALVFLIAALVSNWRTNRRNLLLSTLVGSVVISAVSLTYIFPEYTAIVASPYSLTTDPELLLRASQWQIIAGSRMLLFAILGLLPLVALSKEAS